MESPNPSGLCMCGCGDKTVLARQNSADGRVGGEPQRYIKHHQCRKSPVEYLVDPDTGCWVWQGALDGHGYGQMRLIGDEVRALGVVCTACAMDGARVSELASAWGLSETAIRHILHGRRWAE